MDARPDEQPVSLADCQKNEREWECPEDKCKKRLTRKQTLLGHIKCFHPEIVGKLDVCLPKRYKLYEADPDIPVPRSTTFSIKRKARSQSPTVSVNADEDDGIINVHVAEDTYIPDSQEWDETNGPLEIERYGDSGDEISENKNDSDMSISSEEETDEDEDKDISKEQYQEENMDPSLYVIPSANGPYHSDITKTEHILSLGAIATRHNLSNAAVSDILQLIQLHIPAANIGITSMKSLKEECGFDKNYLQFQMYCDQCKKTFNENTEVCPTPGCESLKDSHKYFVKSDVCVQLQEVLERPDIWEKIKESYHLEKSDIISDIKSGKSYQKLKEPGEFLFKTNNITLTIFTDGVALFKSSSICLWPIYLIINELPPSDRFQKKNMILWGIWQGVGKPKMVMFLKPFVLDMMKLYVDGFVFNPNKDVVVRSRAMLLIATMDLQARAYVLNMTQHNGEYGCLYCTEPGESTPSGAGYCRAYPYRNTPINLRTDADIKENAANAQNSKIRVNGFYGKCALMYLPYFKLAENVVIDYMHGILLGVTKKMLELWFDKMHSKNDWYIGDKVTNVDRLLTGIFPPYFIHRRPRSINSNRQHWKASELRNWLLFYSLPCLKGVFKEPFLTHFSCLVEGTYILLQEGISPADLGRANMLLVAFVKNVEMLYGKRFMSMNVHNILHLPALVEQWGPLWGWSCFAFESYNGDIIKSIHGKGNVCKDVFWHLQAQKRVSVKAQDISNKSKTKEFIQNLLGKKNFSNTESTNECVTIKMEPLERMEEYEKIVLDDENRNYMICKKVYRNGFLMYSKKSSKVTKQNSYTILLDSTYSDRISALEVTRYVIHKPTKSVFAAGHLLHATETILQNRVHHIKKFERGIKTAVPIQKLREPIIVMNVGDNLYASNLPNHQETD